MSHRIFARVSSLLLTLTLAACSESFVVSEPDPCECAEGEVCSPSGCVAACAADLRSDLATLDSSLRVLATFCEPLEGSLGAFAPSDEQVIITRVSAETLGRDTTMVSERFEGAIASASLRAVGEACSVTFEAEVDAVETTLTDAVAISADGRYAGWGLRAVERLGPDSRRTVDGAWYMADQSCAIEENAFYRVASVAFGDEGRGGPHVFVAGHIAGAPGMGGLFLDERRVFSESTPGSLWRVGEGMLLGGVLGHGSMPATYLPLAPAHSGRELRVGADGVVQGDPRERSFAVVEGRGLIRASTVWESGASLPDGLMVRSIEVGADAIEFGAETRLTGGAFTEAIPVLGSRRILLRHARGLVLVE